MSDLSSVISLFVQNNLWFGILSLIILFGCTAFISALRNLHYHEFRRINSLLSPLPWFRALYSYGFGTKAEEALFFHLLLLTAIVRFFCYSWLTLFMLNTIPSDSWISLFFSLLLLIPITITVTDILPRILGYRYFEAWIQWGAYFLLPFLLCVYPLFWLMTRLLPLGEEAFSLEPIQGEFLATNRDILRVLEEAQEDRRLEEHEVRLVESVVSFRDRVAREVMVPRINIFALPTSTTVMEAAEKLSQEGYSRVPVYQDTIDQISGVLMYKDLTSHFLEATKSHSPDLIHAPITELLKPVLFTPESKLISQLLQEFRKKKIHLAIVVDEYGGTEGMVTIEDILEEIVGEIRDEYDVEEFDYETIEDGVWILDSRMSIYAVEELTGVEIPDGDDYDTLAGFLFDRAGMIPPEGFLLQEEQFDLAVISSNERSVEKVKITLHHHQEEIKEGGDFSSLGR